MSVCENRNHRQLYPVRYRSMRPLFVTLTRRLTSILPSLETCWTTTSRRNTGRSATSGYALPRWSPPCAASTVWLILPFHIQIPFGYLGCRPGVLTAQLQQCGCALLSDICNISVRLVIRTCCAHAALCCQGDCAGCTHFALVCV